MILTDWQKEDLEDLQETYPNLDEMTDEELELLSNKLYREAQGLFDRMCRLESDAENIKLFMQVRKESTE
jgi:hypothetical protein